MNLLIVQPKGKTYLFSTINKKKTHLLKKSQSENYEIANVPPLQFLQLLVATFAKLTS